jgi:hypothetical protein
VAHSASVLRAELSRLAQEYAITEQLPFYQSRGTPPVTLFKAHKEGSCHGNFEDDSYQAILSQPALTVLEAPCASSNRVKRRSLILMWWLYGPFTGKAGWTILERNSSGLLIPGPAPSFRRY